MGLNVTYFHELSVCIYTPRNYPNTLALDAYNKPIYRLNNNSELSKLNDGKETPTSMMISNDITYSSKSLPFVIVVSNNVCW